MKFPDASSRTYSDTPARYPGLITGGLQLIFWLYFRPSAWDGLVTQIDPALRPDFSLTTLSHRSWQNRALRRLLVQAFLAWPILAATGTGLILVVIGASLENVVFGVGYGVLLGGTGTLVVWTVVSVAAGAAGGIAICTAFGVAAGVTLEVAGGMGAYVQDLSNIGPVVAVVGTMVGVVNPGPAVGAMIALAIGMSGYLAGRPSSYGRSYSLTRQTGGVAVGVLVSGFTYGLVVLVVVGILADVASLAVISFIFGIVIGVAVAVACCIRTSMRGRSLVFGAAVGAVGAAAVYAAFEWAGGSAFGVVLTGTTTAMLYSAFFVLSFVLAEHVAGPWAGAVASAFGSGGALVVFLSVYYDHFSPWVVLPTSLVFIFLGLALPWWQSLVAYPFVSVWNTLLYRAEERRGDRRSGLLPWHSVFWDEYQRLPLRGLDDHLFLVMHRDAEEGRAAMAYVAGSRQRWAAQAVQLRLDIERLKHCKDIEDISKLHTALAASEPDDPAGKWLHAFTSISQDSAAAGHQGSLYHQRLMFSDVERRIDALLQELIRSGDRYAVQFRPVAAKWRNVVTDHVTHLVETADFQDEIDNPYVVYTPLTLQQEVFVGRSQISSNIAQLVRNQETLSMLLYGQRRMGKTSLLLNLRRLLPHTIVPLAVDLQGGPGRAEDFAGFLHSLAHRMVVSARQDRSISLPALDSSERNPFSRFDEWLDSVEEALGDRTVLLALDEFEALFSALARGRLDAEDVLGTLRHIIQHRPRFKVLLAGSHPLEEYRQWAGNLINVQVVEIGYLGEDEARQLIERPIEKYSLIYSPDAVQRVLALTRCHPALLQLLCYNIVSLKNEHPAARRHFVEVADVEEAVPRALHQGTFFFIEIENQAREEGVSLLRYMSGRGEGGVTPRSHLTKDFSDEVQHTVDFLLQRETIEPAGDGYRFQVELVRRWFGMATP